jgi:hypothetical protein
MLVDLAVAVSGADFRCSAHSSGVGLDMSVSGRAEGVSLGCSSVCGMLAAGVCDSRATGLWVCERPESDDVMGDGEFHCVSGVCELESG